MGEYPLHLARRRRLADGREVVIRPIRAEDVDAEQRFLQALSPETRRLRYPAGVDLAGREKLEFLTRVDYDRHMAFVCEAGDGELAGNASYVVHADGRGCEFGIVVAEVWRHAGVGRLLMDALMRAAQARRLETMEGLVMSENRDMLRFAEALDFDVHPDPDHAALVRVVKKL